MSDIFYDIESGCYRTYPDGDEASGNRIREEFDSKDLYIKQLQQENQKYKEVIDNIKYYLEENDSQMSEDATYDLMNFIKEV